MTKPDAIHLSDDLLFASRVAATAQAHGLRVATVRDTAALLSRVGADSPACVILDLQVAGTALTGMIDALRQLPARSRIVGYGSHVDSTTLNAARVAGCDLVLPRSAFAERLEIDLPSWFSQSS